MRSRTVTLLTLIAWVSLFPTLHAQQQPYVAPRDLLNVLPSPLEIHALAVGDRIRRPGKERTLFTGILHNERGERAPVTIAVQLPNLVRLEGLRTDGSSVVFDGKNPFFPNSRLEEQLVELFSSDTAEGMLSGVKEGAAIELLGRRVLVGRDQPEIRYDIFEVSGPLRSSASGRERLKSYFFDSETALLASARYLDEAFSPPVVVEISFSDWKQHSGSAYPQRIDRKEDGHPVFSLTLSSIVAMPRQDPTTFAQFTLKGSLEE
jgi:hypothetical protein